MTEERTRYLLSLYLQQKASRGEQEELFSWINNLPADAPLRDALAQAYQKFIPDDTMDDQRAARILGAILDQTGTKEENEKKIVRLPVFKWAAAAAVLIAVSVMGYQYFSAQRRGTREAQTGIVKKESVQPDIQPGTNSAKLTLGDGSSVLLDTLSRQTIASQGTTRIVKLNGRVVYQNSTAGQPADMYNTLTTDRGHQYPLTLSDGTKVFLNAASSIRFPVSFTGSQRSVEITGEAYFEVAKNGKPFIVHAGAASVEVLGTHFDVNAYADEAALSTTLLEGSVKISKGNAALLLVPGQQGQITPDGTIALNKNADTEAAVSWTQGYFHFADASLETVLRQLARWYDVDVIYEKHYPDETFGGDIQKSLALAQVLKLLDKSQVRFRIQGKQLIMQ